MRRFLVLFNKSRVQIVFSIISMYSKPIFHNSKGGQYLPEWHILTSISLCFGMVSAGPGIFTYDNF
jgi:hypothetical protein